VAAANASRAAANCFAAGSASVPAVSSVSFFASATLRFLSASIAAASSSSVFRSPSKT
jgi:hypothetical protein